MVLGTTAFIATFGKKNKRRVSMFINARFVSNLRQQSLHTLSWYMK